MHSKPGFIVWFSAVISVACAVGALILFLGADGADRNAALGILLIAGLAALGGVWRLVRLYRTATEVADAGELPIGSVLRPSRRKAMAVAIVTLAIGAVPLLAMDAPAPALRWGAWLFVATGALLLVLVAAGVLPIGHLALREEGLVFTTRGAPLVLPWERIRAVEGGEFGGNPAFFLWLDDPDTMPVAPSRRRAFLRNVSHCRAWMGSDYYHFTTSYETGLATIVAAIARQLAARAGTQRAG